MPALQFCSETGDHPDSLTSLEGETLLTNLKGLQHAMNKAPNGNLMDYLKSPNWVSLALAIIHISATPSFTPHIQRARWGEVEVILTSRSHFLTQPYVSASFVLAKSWQVAEKLFPFTLTEFSKAAVRAQASSWAKGHGAWKGHLEGGSPGKRNCCSFQSTRHSTEAGWRLGEILYWGEKISQNTVLDFSTASSCLLNNAMKISFRDPVTLAQRIWRQPVLQATFNSLQMELSFSFSSLGNPRCLWGTEHENRSKTQRA